MWGILIAIVFLVLFIFALLTLGEGLLKVTASQAGEDASDYSVLPSSLSSILGRSKGKADYIPEGEHVKQLNRGFDVNLLGAAEAGQSIRKLRSTTYALKPKDFIGMTPIPKVIPEPGTQIKAGDPLFYDKKHPEIIYAAPVSGEFIEIRRGEKRSINEVVVLADQGDFQYRKYDDLPDLASSSREDLVTFLTGSGAWPFIRQRPFDVVADPTETPKSIFVSTFDTAPLAPNLNLAVDGKEEVFYKGLEVLTKLTDGKVHLGLDGRGKRKPAKAFMEANIEGVERHWFKGLHPAGNVGIHIHHVDPVLPNTPSVWHLNVHAVLVLGNLFLNGKFDTEMLVAVTGAEVGEPYYAWIHQGIALDTLLESMGPDFEEHTVLVQGDEGKVEEVQKRRSIRIVSGDLLSGKQVERSSFLGFFDDQLSTVKEGDYYELLGWLVPQKGHPTMSRTFPNGFVTSSTYRADTNTNGEKRAFVVSGQYEAVLPMDIYPQHVIRAVMAKDYEKMEGLGILELGEEDIAICEYVCTSKQPLQSLLREGLDEIREQM